MLCNRYLGASYDVPSLVEKLLHQLASKQTIVVNVYDTTDKDEPINMYGTNVTDTGLLHISSLDFGDPARKHEMHCRSDFVGNCFLHYSESSRNINSVWSLYLENFRFV